MIQSFITLLLLFLSHQQVEPKEELPQGYFTFPIAPGSTASLSGTFGDIRINHFHAGLDIRTGGRTGKSVFAAAEGYVSRIGVSRGGYGNALYITHPNGFTTVYGHLNEFMPKIKKALLQKQYQYQKWEVDLYFETGEIPVRKAEMVAYSGNTGGSGGPHLHFEIRDKQERTIDPSLFGFKEIKDNIPPHIELLSVVCKSTDARVNGKFGTIDVPLKKTSTGNYVLSKPLHIKGKVGFEIYAYDKNQFSPFKLGIKEIIAKKNDQTLFKYHLGRQSFHNKIDMNLHTNYERMLYDRKKFHKVYYEEGNTLGFYEMNQNNGLFTFNNARTERVDITAADTYGNTSKLSFLISSNSPKLATNSVPSIKRNGRFLVVDAPSNATIGIRSDSGLLPESTERPIVIDLNHNFVSQVLINQKEYPLDYNTVLGPDHRVFRKNNFALDMRESTYTNQPVFLAQKEGRLLLDKDVVPLKGRFQVKWKDAFKGDKTKAKAYLEGKRKPKYVGGEWHGDTLTFEAKEFGTYLILEDLTPPTVRVISQSANKLKFRISDDLSGIKDFQCYVNGEWVLMEYEYKNGQIWSEKLNNSKPFKGKVDLYVNDQNGNQKYYTSTID